MFNEHMDSLVTITAGTICYLPFIVLGADRFLFTITVREMRFQNTRISVTHFAALALRRCPNIMSYSFVPRSSRFPAILILKFEFDISQSALAYMMTFASPRVKDLSKSKSTGLSPGDVIPAVSSIDAF